MDEMMTFYYVLFVLVSELSAEQKHDLSFDSEDFIPLVTQQLTFTTTFSADGQPRARGQMGSIDSIAHVAPQPS